MKSIKLTAIAAITTLLTIGTAHASQYLEIGNIKHTSRDTMSGIPITQKINATAITFGKVVDTQENAKTSVEAIVILPTDVTGNIGGAPLSNFGNFTQYGYGVAVRHTVNFSDKLTGYGRVGALHSTLKGQVSPYFGGGSIRESEFGLIAGVGLGYRLTDSASLAVGVDRVGDANVPNVGVKFNF